MRVPGWARLSAPVGPRTAPAWTRLGCRCLRRARIRSRILREGRGRAEQIGDEDDELEEHERRPTRTVLGTQ